MIKLWKILHISGLLVNWVRVAVIAHIRHAETNYDELLAAGYDRREARAAVELGVFRVLGAWEASG